jgi:hypothetical protein
MYRGIQREPAAVLPAQHFVTISLVDQAAPDESAEDALPHLGLYLGDGGDIKPCRCMKIHIRYSFSRAGRFANIRSRLKHSVHNATVKTKFQCWLTSALSTLSEAAGAKMGVFVQA